MDYLKRAKSLGSEVGTKVSNRVHKGIENKKELANLGCTAEQVRENSKAIAHIGEHLMKNFPDKDGGMFKKKVEGFKSMANVVDCDAFYAAKRQAKGGKRRRKSRRKRRKSRKKRRKSKKRKSRRRRKKSRRRRRR